MVQDANDADTVSLNEIIDAMLSVEETARGRGKILDKSAGVRIFPQQHKSIIQAAHIAVGSSCAKFQ
ncbi:hypothetical protein BH10PSE12_BH10PSE12_15770 [soil metagenome]